MFGEVIAGVNFFKDIGAGLRNIFGGRAEGYEEEIAKARDEAISEMIKRASRLGANAIVGVKIDYEPLVGSSGGSMLMATASGTAVTVE